MQCATMIHQFDPQLHKELYRVGVYASEGEVEAFNLYGTLFTEYLTATAGQRLNPPVSFELIPVTLTSLMELAGYQQVDFMFSSSAVLSCMSTEYDAQPLATIINRRESRGREYDLDVYGGVMFVLKDNDEVNTIEDFRGRTVGAGSITAMGGGQTQFYELFRHGLSFAADLKQVVFTKDERLVVQGLLDGDFEIGFARTDQIERHVLDTGEALNEGTFKIINPQTHVLQDGRLFPFVSSTSLHPEWPVAALPHVDPTLAKEVQDALLAIRDHELSISMNDYLRCDTTGRIAELAREATRRGSFVGFRTARSYFQVRTKQEAAGFIRPGTEIGDLRCIRGDTLYQDIECPADHYKVTEEEFDLSCEMAGLSCKDEYECFCQPCIKAYQVDIYQYSNANHSEANLLLDGQTQNSSSANSSATGSHQQGCAKMSLCGLVEQRHKLVFHMVDNKERDNPEIEIIMHLTDRDVELEATQIGHHLYEIVWSDNRIGVGIMEVFFDGEQIPESPIRAQVIPRDCEADNGVSGMIANSNGECVCGENTVDIGGKCVEMSVFAIAGSLLGVLVIGILTVMVMQYKIEKNDELWKVHAEELHMDDPVEIVGQGSFGVVLLAVSCRENVVKIICCEFLFANLAISSL